MSDSLNPFVAIANSPEGQSGVSLTKSFKKCLSFLLHPVAPGVAGVLSESLDAVSCRGLKLKIDIRKPLTPEHKSAPSLRQTRHGDCAW